MSATATPEAPAPPLGQNLAWLLSQASHVMATEMTAAFEALGFPARGYCVLSTALTGDYTQKDLATMVGLDKTTMVATIDELEQAGLARRRPSEADRRAHIIEVTKAGEKAVAKGQHASEQVQQDVLASLPAAQRDALMHGLSGLVCGRLSEPAACQQAPRRRS